MNAGILDRSESVLDLSDQHFADATSALLKTSGRVRRFFLRTHLGVVVWQYSRLLRGSAKKLTNDALWFSGLAKQVSDLNVDVHDTADRLVARIDAFKKSLNDSRGKALSQRAAGEGLISPRLAAALDDYIASCALLHEAVESLKWAVKEQKASFSRISEGYQATSPEELDALFDRLG